MVMNIANALSAYRQSGAGNGIDAVAGTGSVPDNGTGSFLDTVKGFMGDTMGALQESDKAANNAVAGKGDLATIVTAIGKAEQMLTTVVAIRDKVISAYQDISKTAI